MSENHAAQEPPVLYTMEEAAEILRVSREYLYRMRQRGQLVVVKFGRRTGTDPARGFYLRYFAT
jgi:excisionase family DNA binding protein